MAPSIHESRPQRILISELEHVKKKSTGPNLTGLSQFGTMCTKAQPVPAGHPRDLLTLT